MVKADVKVIAERQGVYLSGRLKVMTKIMLGKILSWRCG